MLTTKQYQDLIPKLSNDELMRGYESVESLMQHTVKERPKWSNLTTIYLSELQKRGLKPIN